MSPNCNLSYCRARPQQRSAGVVSCLHGHRGQIVLLEGRRRKDAKPPHSPTHYMAPLHLKRGRYVVSIKLLHNNENPYCRNGEQIEKLTFWTSAAHLAPEAGRMENRLPPSLTTGLHVNSAAWLCWFRRVTELLYSDRASREGMGRSTSEVVDSSRTKGTT